jgi:glycosyltransferase involved in cell wall biosynthesis
VNSVSIRFSILMPVYNRRPYLQQAVDSVLAQTFTDYELITVDDGSTDGSVELLNSYGEKIKILHQSHQGPEVARNKAAAFAEGEYLLFLDSDDFLFPFALATFDQVIRSFDSPPLLLGTMLFLQDGQGFPNGMPKTRPTEVFKFRNYLSKTRPLGDSRRSANGMGSMVVRKSVFHEVGGMRRSTPDTFHVEDTHLFLKLGGYGPCIFINEPPTYAYRQHASNSTKNPKAIADGILRLAYSERHGEYLRSSKIDRYALIGGRAAHWAYRYCWGRKQKKLAIRLLAGTAPMVVVALFTKFLKKFSKATNPAIVLPENPPESGMGPTVFQVTQDARR